VVDGGHWVVKTRPAQIAEKCIELIDHVEDGTDPRGLRAARAAANPSRAGHFAGKLVVVTGAGSGIGRATALEYARCGADVVVSDINASTADATAAEVRALGVDAAAYQLDVADIAAFESFAKQVQGDHGVADIVVNNAGIGIAGPFLDTSDADWTRIIDINVRGVISGSRLFAQQMVDSGRHGQVVNIASAAAYTPSKMYPAYATTKAAVLMLTECLRAEFAAHGIGAVAICPGFVNTDISRVTHYVGVNEKRETELQRRAVKSYGRRNYSPERAAKQIVKASARNKAVAPVAIEARLLRGIARFTPRLARAFARVDMSGR
jgi:NAD(P)-dependent dehydrogenase (short-subunit alcohol dehydrogenase family)